MKKTGRKISALTKIAFVFFALFLCLQAVVVFSIELFGDDYYYATFTDSSDFFVSENIRHFKEVNGRVLVHLFDELGSIEAAWFFSLDELGPFIIDIDAEGNNLFDTMDVDIAERKRAAMEKLGIGDDFEFTKLY